MDTNSYPEGTSDQTPDERALALEHGVGDQPEERAVAEADGPQDIGAEAHGAAAIAPAASTAGALLSAARLRSGLSIAEVANHLKLSIRQVESLEADTYERLPSPMFVRGFAKSYARLVQIDAAPVLAALESRLPTDSLGAIASRMAANQPLPRSPIPFPSTDQPSRRLHSVAALLAAVVVGFLAFEWLGTKLQSPEPAAPPQASTVAPRGGPAVGAATEPVGVPAGQQPTMPDVDPSRPVGVPAAPGPAGAAEVGSALLARLKPGGARRTRSLDGDRAARADARDRLWTLLVKRHAELWRAGAYLFGRAVDQHVPPLQSRALRTRKKSPAPAATPPASTSKGTAA